MNKGKSVSGNAISPIGVLIDELKAEDPKRRINSIKSFSTIASAIGPDRTRSELLPFVNELLDDEDEVLLQLAESLSALTDFIGGNQFAHLLLVPLEKLCYIEDVAVRDRTTQTIIKVVGLTDMKKYEENVAQLIRRLVNGDYFTAKGAACAIIPGVFPLCSPNLQNELVRIYTALSNDETPLTRKFASMHLRYLMKYLNSGNETELINSVKTFMKDDQDFVKLYIVDSLVVLGQVLSPQKHANNVIIFVRSLAEDPSWRIRYTIADKIYELGQALGKPTTKSLLLPYYVKFLQDPEPEIKTIAAARLAKLAEFLDESDITSKIVPCLGPLSKDPMQHVRAALAESLPSLCPIVGKKPTTDYILPIFLTLLKDEFSEVRVNLFKHLEDLTKVIDLDSLSSSILPALNELAVDKNWRTRAAVVEFLPFFAQKMGEGFLNDKFSKILIDWLQDRIYGVREAAIRCIKNLIDNLGSQWAEKQLFPKIIPFQSNPNYLHRMTLLFIIQSVGNLLSPEALSKTITPILIPMSKDPVANVRMHVSKALKIVIPRLKDKSGEICKKALIQLTEDSDPDVKLEARTN